MERDFKTSIMYVLEGTLLSNIYGTGAFQGNSVSKVEGIEKQKS